MSLDTQSSRLIYVGDAYCGWCWGRAPQWQALAAVWQQELPVEVISGGLFIGPRVQPMARLPYLASANLQIQQMTGAEFGAPYQALLSEGRFCMDSMQAARGLISLKSQAPERATELFHLLQAAFYQQGLDLGASATYQQLAQTAGLDPDAILHTYATSEAQAVAEFQLARQLGVEHYPSLVLWHQHQAHPLPISTASLEELHLQIRALLTRT
ncbi:DsbA family protein [Marinospirillum sp.]|uniref:DsbA family protein n=1 Tax=Marinospirillum sp. TaxID=2183934 RepID=UPI003A8A498D